MPEVEIGTPSNPIVFTGVIAGEALEHPDNPFYLWNDKGGIQNSVDAKEITMQVIGLEIQNELVGFSNGTANQSFTVAFPPVIENAALHPLQVKVNGVVWTEVEDVSLYGQFDTVYEFDYLTGTVTFGDDINGAIPANANTIEVTYTPDKVEYGTEVEEFNWFGVRSSGVIANDVTVLLERQTSTDTTHVTAFHTPMVTVTGVWLGSDPNRLATNYFTGGSFNTATGVITLGTALPGANTEVLIDYEYTIEDDSETAYTHIGLNQSHTFLNPIPSNNAKRFYIRILPPETASPIGMGSIGFKLMITYKA